MIAQGKLPETMSISAILNDCISTSLRPSPDESIEEEDGVQVTRPTALMDDNISKGGSKGHASNDEEILEFPEDDAMDLDMDLDGSMMPDLDLVVPDVVVPEVVVPDLESNATMKVTQVRV